MNLFSSVFGDGLTVGTYLFASLVALLCGGMSAFCTSRIGRATKSLIITLTVLPIAVETVIIMVNGSIGTGIAVAGAFSLVRFRSAPGRARDIALIFIAMTAGICCASGYVAIAVIFTLIACGVVLCLGRIKLSEDRELSLRITVPEALNFEGAFDEIFEKYTDAHKLLSVKTSNMGSLYKLSYIIEMKSESKLRELVDELRVRNGNLEISVSKAEESEEL